MPPIPELFMKFGDFLLKTKSSNRYSLYKRYIMKFIKKKIVQETPKEVENKLEEAVAADRTYDYDSLATITAEAVEKIKGVELSDDEMWEINRWFEIDSPRDSSEIYADSVDRAVEKVAERYSLTDEQIEYVEQQIAKSTTNPAGERKTAFEEDLDTLEQLCDDEEYEIGSSSVYLFSPFVRSKLYEFISELRNSGYTGLKS